ncbi:TPA: hypothetical protein EYP37_09235 [Candidatus Poribacteria bacterium]|nr:hypothetical protein [Candidatus Poribacteria bacterium]
MSDMRAEMHTRIDGLRAEMLGEIKSLRSEMMGEIEKLRSEVHRNFRWLVGIILGVLFPMWVTVILTILFKK